MITNGKFYNYITDPKEGKYSTELKSKIEEMGQECLDNLDKDIYSPIMMLGSIQSGKTRAFIGLMALCFDNDFDITIILTKCSKALVEQTVKRMDSEFAGLKQGKSTVGDIVAQNILDISFSGCASELEKRKRVNTFLKHYPDKKRIIVVKKQADNVDRMNMLIRGVVENGKYKRILIVDDEADITSIGYEKDYDSEQLSLRRISGAINTARKQLHSDIQHVLMQVTATPYALYLQPGVFSIGDIMPIRPERTIVLPTGDGYIGADYYFKDSEDNTSPNYDKAKYLPHIVPQSEMDLLNGNVKNKSKGKAVKDGRTVKKDKFLDAKFVLPNFRDWLFDCLVGAAIVQLNKEYKDCYLSAVLHVAISKAMHKVEMELLEIGIECIKQALEKDINDASVWGLAKASYDDLVDSVQAYKVLSIPSFDLVKKYIADIDFYGDLEGLITSTVVKEVNSDNDIDSLLNSSTGELRLEDKLTIFVGGQVIDRGITIPNLISFFYGRDPKKMQQDTVMQHCRMFGYRGEELLSVTRLYTTQRLLNNLQEIAERDAKLRERMITNPKGGIVYLEAGADIVACSQDKILASDVRSILPGKRYLPVGFNILSTGRAQHTNIDKILKNAKIGVQKNYNKKTGGVIDESYCDFVDKDIALEILRQAYAALDPDLVDGKCNQIQEMENIFLFSLEQKTGAPVDKIALLVRRGRQLEQMKKKNGIDVYQDAPEDGNNEGAIAQALRSKYPVLVLTEQCNPVWKRNFWWPLYYTPEEMNVGIYAKDSALTNVYENLFSSDTVHMQIGNFPLVDKYGVSVELYNELASKIQEIKSFHDAHFDYSNQLSYTGSRSLYDCNIILEAGPSEKEEKRFARKLKGSIEKIREILEQKEIPQKLQEKIKHYCNMLLQGVINEELSALHDAIIEELNVLGKKCIDAIFIRKTILELDPFIHDLFEVLGYFLPKGGGMCEIHLYYDRIKDGCKTEDEFVAMLSCVAAHEMEHAWHFADVMTESGKWLYSRTAYLKQGWVQESVAEYFALCYTKKMNSKAKKFAEDFIRNDRDINKFPKDGGYSGALILEKEAKIFDELYLHSLKDLPYTYDKYLKKFAK